MMKTVFFLFLFCHAASADRPSVSLLQKTPSSPVSCHATGFYPDRASMSWRKDGEEIHEDVDHGEILPNHDGTFQMRVDLNISSVKPEDWSRYDCVFQFSGAENIIIAKLDKAVIRTNWGLLDTVNITSARIQGVRVRISSPLLPAFIPFIIILFCTNLFYCICKNAEGKGTCLYLILTLIDGSAFKIKRPPSTLVFSFTDMKSSSNGRQGNIQIQVKLENTANIPHDIQQQ
ncbi:hereditary hemochromatosis protein homolog [Anabas testudineus]|uniref:hereditary hemochromatosis protein homolog n=1 Tax=Anabas testudineus TaxID=64144 RepID=UPI00143DEB39|nr:hereditary hemochromatosis protein homolog [Anabas testudineus]